MWTQIFIFLLIIGTVIYKSTPSLTNCSKRVQRCPVKKDQWAQKNDLLNCTTSFGYVCLRDASGYLYESCMANFSVRANSGNCPTLFACQDNKPYLGTDTTYYLCPEDVSGCPPRNHAEYRVYQLYKYPKCIESNISDEMENTSVEGSRVLEATSQTSTTSMASTGSSDLDRQETKGVVIPLVITLVIVALLGCFIGCICPTLYACYKNIPYLGKETTYHYCPEDVSGCPPRNHAAYSIYQLYKYPKCVESNLFAENGHTSTKTTIIRSMDTSTDDVKRQESIYAVTVIFVSTLTLTVLRCIISCVLQSGRKTT